MRNKNKNKVVVMALLVSASAGIFFAPVVQAASTGFFQYKLLEGIPGFFNKGDVVPDLETLISAVYKFGIWTVGISAMFMMIIGGFTYMLSAGNKSTAGDAKKIITDSLLGVVVALTAYLFLYVINPDLTKINLNLFSVEIEDIVEMEDAEVSSSVSGSLVNRNGYRIDSEFSTALNKIKNNGVNAMVTSGLRTVETQIRLIRQNCGGYPPTRACSPPTCLLKNGPGSCPHTTGRAADIWALAPDGRQAISQKQCQANITACFNNQYQKALVAAMRAEGFCVLSSEPWHFEKPKMSQSCT